MAHHKSLWAVPALALLLIIGAMVTVGTAAAAKRQGMPEKTLAQEERVEIRKKEERRQAKSGKRYRKRMQKERVEIRKKEERRQAKRDKRYRKQMRAKAKYYKRLAKLVKKQGGDPTPLFEATAYFKNKDK